MTNRLHARWSLKDLRARGARETTWNNRPQLTLSELFENGKPYVGHLTRREQNGLEFYIRKWPRDSWTPQWETVLDAVVTYRQRKARTAKKLLADFQATDHWTKIVASRQGSQFKRIHLRKDRLPEAEDPGAGSPKVFSVYCGVLTRGQRWVRKRRDRYIPDKFQPRTVKQGHQKVPAKDLKRLAHRPIHTHWKVTHVDCEKCLGNLALECSWAGIEDMAAWEASERLEGPAVKRRRGRPGKGVQLPRRNEPEPTMRIAQVPKVRVDDLDDWADDDRLDDVADRLDELLFTIPEERDLTEEEQAELSNLLGASR